MEDLDNFLASQLSGSRAPSLTATAVVQGEVRAAGAAGVRKRGDSTFVTVGDKYHVGSCAKSMTATLAGVLVERGIISWERRIGEVFPELMVHPGYEAVTLKQLLAHTAGLPAYTDPATDNFEDDVWEAVRSPTELRRESILPTVLRRVPLTPPGEVFEYSNVGYIIAGAMLEKVTGAPFETLIRSELFEALGMTSVGFGAPGMPGRIDEPYGHDDDLDPLEPGPDMDNPPAFAPAGTIHMSVLDFATYLRFHVTGKPRLVSKKTLNMLHTPTSEEYALGWRLGKRDWANGPFLIHGGTNTMFFALIWLAPNAGFGVVSMCNVGPNIGAELCLSTANALRERYLVG